MSSRVAAIDLGTNTALLLVAERAADGTLHIVREDCRTPRLGAGLARTGLLDAHAAERALAVLREFARAIADAGVAPSRVRAVGTACLRRARDGSDFVRRARTDCGLEVEIVPEDEEARLGERALVVAGAGDDALSIDVGGGSSEVACRARALRCSIPIGAVVLTETFLDPERPDPARFASLRAAVAEAVAALPADAAVGRAAWAIGGTAVHLASLDSGLARFDPRAVEGREVDARRAGDWAERLSLLVPAARRALPIEPERADILPAGLAVLGAVTARLGAPTVRVSAFGLRHALADELLTAAGD